MHECVRTEYRKFQKQQRWSSPPKRYSTTASHSAGSFGEPPAGVRPGWPSCDSSTSSGGIKPVAAAEAPEKGSPPDSPQRTRSLA